MERGLFYLLRFCGYWKCPVGFDLWKMKPKDKQQITGGQSITGKKLVRARLFRPEPTAAESKAWEIPRGAELSIVVELDGSVHDSESAQQYDAERTLHFAIRHLTVIRVRNDEISVNAFERLLQPLIA